jgi:hypothetical protein
MSNHFKSTVKVETYPKANYSDLSQSFRTSNLSQNLNIIPEEDQENEENEENEEEPKQTQENGKIVFHINSQWDEKFPSEYQQKYKDDEYKDDEYIDDTYIDDTYKNTILKNPYI